MTPTLSTPLIEPNVPVAASAGRRLCFAALLLTSGFCGISYEVLYARILSNFIGDQFAVSASILLSFMLGIGLGTLCAHRLWRWLWLIEAGIGACGAALALSSEWLQAWFYSAAPLQGSLAGAMLVCLVLLSVPSFLIGCSLPLFAGYLDRFGAGRAFARAYTIYNFGAALTVLVIEFWLLRQLGVRHTVLAIAALNGVAAAALFFGFRDLRRVPAEPPQSAAIPRRHLVALASASVGSAVFQLLMVKIAECLLGPFRETFVLVLALVLAGIAGGSALTRRWRVSFGWLLVAGLGGLAWLMAGFEWVALGYAWVYPATYESALGGLLHRVVALTLLMGVPAVAFGATIPALLGELGDVARDSGKLLCLSSLANAAGFLLMALVLHRHLDYGVLIIVVAAFAALGVLVYARGRGRVALAAGGIFVLVAGLHPLRWDEKLLYVCYDQFESVEELQRSRRELKFTERFKGAQDVFSLNHFGDHVAFFINGYVSIWLNSSAEKIVGALPVMFAPRTDRALVLGVGSGSTAGTAACLVDRLDCVEINPAVLQNQWRMAEHNFGIADKKQVNFILDDGIHFMNVSREEYPLIINTVTSPRYFSSSKLYTREFLESVRRRLAHDGVYVTWVDSRIGPRGLDIILKTIAQSFPQCGVAGIRSGYFLLLCSREPIRLRRPELVTGHPVLANYFQTNGVPPALLPYGLFTTRGFALIGDTNAHLNTMDYPALEFEMARLNGRYEGDFAARLCAQLDFADIARALEPKLAFNALDLTLFSTILYEDSSITMRNLELAEAQVDDFREKFRQLKLNFHLEWASLFGSAEAYFRLGAELMAQRRLEEAIVAEERALALLPNVLGAHFTIGVCQEKLGRFEPAVTNYLHELRLNPKDERILLNLGRVHFKLGRQEQALDYLRRAMSQEDRPEIHLHLSQVFEALGKSREAEEEYQRALTFGNKPARSRPAGAADR